MPLSRVDTEYSIHRVRPTPSTAHTEYCIHRVLHHPKSDCLPLPASLAADHVVLNSLHSHDYELTNEYRLSCHCTSLQIYHLQIHHLQVLLQSQSIMASKCISTLARSRPPRESLSYTITASKCISKLARSRPPSASLSSP
jgi:hypothetical protein